MTGRQLQDQLAALGLGQAAFARLIGRDPVTINRYGHARLDVPRDVAVVVALLAMLPPKRRAAAIARFSPD